MSKKMYTASSEFSNDKVVAGNTFRILNMDAPTKVFLFGAEEDMLDIFPLVFVVFLCQ